jgi:hypothetical protein
MQTLSKGNEHLSTMIQSCKKEFDFSLGIIIWEKLNVSNLKKISGANEVGRYQKETRALQLVFCDQVHNHRSFLYGQWHCEG